MPEPAMFVLCALGEGEKPPGLVLGSFDARGPVKSRVLKMARAAFRNAAEKLETDPLAYGAAARLVLYAVDCDLPPQPSGPKFYGPTLRITGEWRAFDRARQDIALDGRKWKAKAVIAEAAPGAGPPRERSLPDEGPPARPTKPAKGAAVKPVPPIQASPIQTSPVPAPPAAPQRQIPDFMKGPRS